jgi:hypothetical protein
VSATAPSVDVRFFTGSSCLIYIWSFAAALIGSRLTKCVAVTRYS